MSWHTIETTTAQGELTGDARRWEAMMNRCFGNPPADEEGLDRWWRAFCTDRVRLRAAWPTGPEPGLGGRTPLATLASLDRTINTGGGHVEPADFITDVTVRTSMRRRGLLTELLRLDLAEAAERGLALAALTASEATIYRRFGFGPATGLYPARLDTRAGCTFLASEPEGTMQEIDLDAAPGILDEVFAAFHLATRGSHERCAWHDDEATGRWSVMSNRRTGQVRAAAHRDGRGRADGIVTFVHRTGPGSPFELRVEVKEMIAAHESAELALWRYLASMDLVHEVSAPQLNPGSALPWVLTDPRRLTREGGGDLNWLRILDVPRALRVRGWDGQGRLRIAVRDRLGLADGVFDLEVGPDGAEVNRVEGPADVAMDVSTLGSLYLGLADPVTLAVAGLLTGEPAAIAELRRIFVTDRAPYSITMF